MATRESSTARPPEFPQPTFDFNFVSRAAGLKAIDPAPVEPHSGHCIDNLFDLVAGIALAEAANSRLIAAAPELLEALKCAETVLILLNEEVERLGLNGKNVLPKIKAAIRKATGADRG